jgi:hypothetical protein
MKKSILRYGGFSVLFMTLFFIADDILLGDKLSYSAREITGMVGIFISTLFIWFGIKYYRDRHNNGILSFGQAMKLGLLILIFPSVAFGIFNVVYIILNPGFLDSYYAAEISQIRASMSAAEAEAQISKLQKDREFFGSPVMQFLFMFATVFAVGLIVTVISALWLRRSGQARLQTA